ncbi:type II toxin-antitoxin system RelE/ParE family toxin [Taklimakanibacter lacteus]|uniref:type II toxin-antitoxin system RelE/ParE family toxin n=1 Tax=Taklimakanibacter lacteus TaxID=2268456 RepID=UPI000E66101C
MIEIKQSATFRKWFSKLRDKRARALIAMRLQRLEDGNAGDVAPVGDGISELRIHHGPGYRVYFQRRGVVIVLLLCGGDKSTQDKDIRTAKRLAADWSDDNG